MPEIRLYRCYFLFQAVSIVVHNASIYVQRVIAHQQCIQYDACGINVYFLAITLRADLLWCHVKRCSYLLFMSLFYPCPLFSWKSEINHFQIYIDLFSIWCKLDVFWLDISVNNVLLMDVKKTIKKPFHDKSCFIFWIKWTFEVFNFIFLKAKLMLPKLKGIVELCKKIRLIWSDFTHFITFSYCQICLCLYQPIIQVLFHLLTFEMLHVNNDEFICLENVQKLNNVRRTN